MFRGNRLEYPSRAAKLDYSHPLVSGGGQLLTAPVPAKGWFAVANPDGSFTELLTNKTYNWATAANQGGEMTAWGPAGFPKTTTSGGVPIPNPQAGQSADSYTQAAIFSPRTMANPQGVVCYSSSGGGAPTVGTGGVMTQALYGTTEFQGVWPTCVSGHVYGVATSGKIKSGGTGGNSLRDWGWVVDFTTGQAWYASFVGTGITSTWAANGSVTTYSGGSVGNGRVMTAAMTNSLLTPEQQIDWLVNDPWGLWFANDASLILGSSAVSRLGGYVDLVGDLAV
jgi:hypothetical protein